ncbi:MAG TPA: hypothetical protein VF719_11965 [Abditibacteriaceae bacterium]|jgi:hypothetical protein
MNTKNRYLEAFKENFNLVGLATIAATAMALTTPIPLFVGLVAEAAYLMFYADSRWYTMRMAKKFDAEIEARRAELKNKVLPQLHPSMQARFERLETVRAGINDSARDEQEWFREVLRKLDFLMEKWLQFAAKDVQFRAYLESVLNEVRSESVQNRRPLSSGNNPNNPRLLSNSKPAQTGLPTGTFLDRWVQQTVQEIQAHYDDEKQGLEKLAEAETDASTLAVLKKRCEVLQRRRDFIGKIEKIEVNLSHQLSLLEDTFGLINDEIRARPPQQVLSDIEDVVSQTNTMTQLLEEVAPYEQLLAS